jgi:hypothetical protein
MEHRQARETCHAWTLHTEIAKENETPRKAFDVRGHRQEERNVTLKRRRSSREDDSLTI